MSLKKLLTALVTVSMVFTLVVPSVLADQQDDLLATAVNRLKQFKIVQGDENGDMHLGDTITRAEIMKVLITALGKGDDAQLLRGAPAFSDTTNHWASGYVALAKAMGLTIGYPDGTFRPDNKITYGEIITLIDRAVGLDVSKEAYTWPNNYIHAAMDAGIIPPGIDATKAAGEFAIRSYVFVLADQAFLNVALPSGKTVYQTYFVTTPPTLTVDQGASVTTSQDTVTISGSTNGVAVMVNDQPVQVTNGTFSTTVKVDVGNSTINVVALDAVKNQTKVAVNVTRTPGAASTITVDLPSSVTAGSTVPVKATVKDSFGNEIPNAKVTATCDAAVGTIDESLTLTVATKVGSGTCTFTSDSATTGPVAVSVVAGPLASITIEGPSTMSSTANQKLTVSGADANGNPVDLSGATVQWSVDKGVIDQSGNFAPGGASGAVTVTAKVNDLTATKTITVFGQPAAINLSLSSNNLAADGAATTTLTATVVDAAGNPVNNYNGTISLQITDGSIAYFGSTAGTTTASVSTTAGVATLTLTTGTTVGSAVITASASGLSGGTVTLTTVAQTLTSFQMSASPTNIGADGASYATITITALDQNGVQMTTLGSDTYSITLQSGTPSVADFSGGSAVVSLRGTNTSVSTAMLQSKPNAFGSTTVTATQVLKNGQAISIVPNPVTVNTVQVYYPAKLSIDPITSVPATAATAISSYTSTGVMTVVVRVLDANGNQVTNPNLNNYVSVTLTSSSSTTQQIDKGSTNKHALQPMPPTNGAATFYVFDPTAGTVTFTASGTYNAGLATTLTSATQTATFTPGAATKIVLSGTPFWSKNNAVVLPPTGTATGTLKVEIHDANDNLVTDGSYSIEIDRVTANGATTNWTNQTVTTHDGVATVTVMASTAYPKTDTFVAKDVSITSSPLTQSAQLAVETMTVGASYQLAWGSDNGTNPVSFQAGTTGTVYVEVQDANNQLNVLDNSTVVTLTLTGQSTGTTSNYTATASNGIATFSINQTVADKYDVTATANGLTPMAKKAQGVVVTAGPATALKLVAEDANGNALPTTIGADGSHITIYAVPVDAYGNSTDATNLQVTWTGTVNPAFSCDLCGQTQAQPAKSPVTVYSTGVPSAFTVTATASGVNLGSASLTITSVPVGLPDHVIITVGSPVTVSDATSPNYQTVTVAVVDYAGNRVTSASKAVYLTVSGGNGGTPVIDGGGTKQASPDLAGAAIFHVYDKTAETVTYTAYLDGNTLKTVTATGTFTPGAAQSLKVGYASPAAIQGNGSTIATVTAKVVDSFGNTVTGATGSVQFNVSSNYAYLLQGTAAGTQVVNLTNGAATVLLQSKGATDDGFVKVQVSCVVCKDADGTDKTASLSQDQADPAITTGALWVYANSSTGITIPVMSATAATYDATAGTVTVTLTSTVPVKVMTGTDTAGYFRLVQGSNTFTNPQVAQGSNPYSIVLTFSGNGIGKGNSTLTMVHSATPAIRAYNGNDPTAAGANVPIDVTVN